MRPPFPSVSERDIRIVSAQLGRQARDVEGQCFGAIAAHLPFEA